MNKFLLYVILAFGGYYLLKRRGYIDGIGWREYCACTQCGYKVENTSSVPCSSRKCPVCGGYMIRIIEGLSVT